VQRVVAVLVLVLLAQVVRAVLVRAAQVVAVLAVKVALVSNVQSLSTTRKFLRFAV
jgi:hypothetical protein